MTFARASVMLALVLAAVLAGRVRAAVVHFDTAAEYEGQFFDNSNGPIFSWSAGAGVGGRAGRIDVADLPRVISTALYRQPFDLRGGMRQESSAFFLTGVTGGLFPHARLGFSPSPGGSFSGGQPWVAVSLRGGDAGGLDYGERFGLVASHVADVNEVADADDATPPAEAFSLFSGHWYKLTTGWTYGGGAFHYDATLTDYGRNGLAPEPSSTQSISGSLTNAALSEPSGVAAMFAGVRADARVTGAWDEFEARTVPEPGATGFFAAAVGAAVLRRSRKSEPEIGRIRKSGYP